MFVKLSATSNFLEQTSFINTVSIFLILDVIPVCDNADSIIVDQTEFLKPQFSAVFTPYS